MKRTSIAICSLLFASIVCLLIAPRQVKADTALTTSTQGAIIITSGDGKTLAVFNVSAGSTITVTPPRGSPEASQIYSGHSLTDAIKAASDAVFFDINNP